MDDIIDFLPIYPDIDDKNFNTKISEKKEFYDYKLEPYEKFPEKPGDLFNHQKLISRFFSSNTPYDQLLLFHDMGTGKTCTSVACIEQIKEENSTFRGAYIFTKGELLHKNYKHDLILKCTKHIKKKVKESYIEEPKYYNKKTAKGGLSYTKIKEYYNFKTFQTFASSLSNKDDDYIIENYSNYIIVIDEVHNIRKSGYIDDIDDDDDEEKKEEMIKIYNQFHRFLHLIKNCKILLMSGTPMKDTFDEIADIMNLILPLNNQMVIKKYFINKYFDKKNEDDDIGIIYSLKKDNNLINELKSFFKGRVSYLKSMQSSIIKKFIGKNDTWLNKFIVFPVTMGDIQNTGYVNALNIDIKKDNKSSFDYNSTLASLFVFPNGSYGKEGYNKYVDNGRLNTEFTTFIKENGTNHEDMLNQIAKCSTKYAFTIRKILENVKNIKDNRIKGKCIFVYSNKVSYGGTILFALLLNTLFDFSSANSKIINTKAKRYILVKSEEGKNLNADIIKEVFNSSKNIYGEYISVIIGSRILSEGFSLFHIQEEFILTPYWNYSETDQAIARGIRSDSHNLLLNGFEYNHLDALDKHELQDKMNKLNIKSSSSKESNINNIIKNKNYIKESLIKPEIHIYLLTAIPDKKYISIDIKHYKISEIKDINNKIIERVIKESSFDCYFNYNRNRYNDIYNNLRECDYVPCDYKCDDDIKNKIDYSTDQLYYLNEEKNISIKNKILNIFKQKYYLTLNDISQYSETLHINIKYFYLFLFQIINNKEIVYNRLGLECFLYENNNIFYISDSNINNNYLSIYYDENINIQKDFKSLNLLLQDKQLDNNFIETLFKETNIDKIINKILELKVEIVEILLEEIIKNKIENKIENNFADLVFDKFLSKYCLKIDKDNIIYISWLKCNKNKKNNLRALIRKESGDLIWVDGDFSVSATSDTDAIKKLKKFAKLSMKNSIDFFQTYLQNMGEELGYYGFLTYDENKNQKFNIIEIKKHTNKKIEVVKKPKKKTRNKDATVDDLRSVNTGKFCESWSKANLINIIIKAKKTYVNPDPDSDDLSNRKISDLCKIIQETFQKNKLIMNYFKY